MKTSILLVGSCLFVALGLTAAPAGAVSFNFADPGAVAPDGTPDHCDFSGEDLCGTTLSWTDAASLITVTASVVVPTSGSPAIIQDLQPDYGGLGIVNSYTDNGDGTGSHSGNDNINGDEVILLTFSTPVFLNTVYFWDDHNTSNVFPGPAKFKFSTTGTFSDPAILLATSVDFGGLAGTTFYFTPKSTHSKHEFYIAGVDVEPVPEPATLGLLGAGLLGLITRRRRRS